MRDDSDISELIARAKSGDEAAIREFLVRFEQEVRIMVRGDFPRCCAPGLIRWISSSRSGSTFFTNLKDRSQDFENVHHLRGFLAGVARTRSTRSTGG